MTPAYAEAREIPDESAGVCGLHELSQQRFAATGCRDRQQVFAGQPFLHGGITCERCHGCWAKEHLDAKGVELPATGSSSSGEAASVASSIVNPAKLPAERRDAICMECHFEGTVAVEQPGKHLYQFQPGDRLSDYIHYFLLSGNQPEKPQALSQVEALSLSACQRKSGDKMWCGSCHDPHAEPGAEEKAAYYRGKCLNCHGEAFAAKHHPDKPDCTKCHMPALPSKDVAHTEGTDHRILKLSHMPRRCRGCKCEARGGASVGSFPEEIAESLATTRDFALAWETLAQRNVEGGCAASGASICARR